MLRTKRATTFLVALLAAFLVLAAVSCDADGPTGPDTATLVDAGTLADAEEGAAAAALASGVAHVVNGKGTVWLGDPWNGWLNISFHAKLDLDGSAKGSWHHQFRARGQTRGGRIFVTVTCLSVDGNQAWVAGYSTQAVNPANVGKWFGLHVIDHGEGDDVADEMSRTLWFGPDEQRAIDLCTLMPSDPPITPIAAGNVQVR